MRNIFTFIFLISIAITSDSQELNCDIKVVSQQIQGTDKRVFDVLQTAVFEFMNNKRWTTDAYKNVERIDCSILINLTERVSSDQFKGTIQIQSRRPIYKTSYNSVLLNYNDNDFDFKYIESQPLDFNENAYTSNLTSVLAFYAYLIIGLDGDSFALNGGTTYLQKALAVANNAQNATEKGWKAFDNDQNRYWLINNMLDPRYIPLRECMYNYHLKGLDVMVDNKESGRAVILESIESLKKIHQVRPLSFNMQVFFNAKFGELIDIFKSAFPDEKSKVISLLNEIDPTNSNNYSKIMMGL